MPRLAPNATFLGTILAITCCIVFGCKPAADISAGSTSRSEPSGNTQSNTEAAYVDTNVGLIFPESVGELEFVEHYVYPERAYGYNVRYETDDWMKLDVYVYNSELPNIPDGHLGQLILMELENAEAGIRYYEDRGDYQDLKKLDAGVYTCETTAGEFSFQSSSFEYKQRAGGGVAFAGMRSSETYIRGYRGHFLKIRITYPQQIATEAEKLRDDFLMQLCSSIAT